MKITIPLKTTNPLNGTHGHWSGKAKQRKMQRALVRWTFLSALPIGWRFPLTITISRLAPSDGLDPHDGLGASLKGVIDGIADALGLKNDRDLRVTWVLGQERSKGYAVRIEMQARL